MARSKSAVLSPADKKAVVTDLKTRIKDAQALVKTAANDLKASLKAHTAVEKETTKVTAAQTKIIDKLQAELELITQKAV